MESSSSAQVPSQVTHSKQQITRKQVKHLPVGTIPVILTHGKDLGIEGRKNRHLWPTLTAYLC